MKIIKPYYKILTNISEDGFNELRQIERAARVCYKSEDRIDTFAATSRFIRGLIKRGHEAMLEHGPELSVKFVCDRGVSHELVRHRIASFAQESTRYCNYSGDKFGNELTFIEPCFFEDDRKADYEIWYNSCVNAERDYLLLIENKVKPEEARTVLTNSLKTEIVVTANYREWRNIFKLRTAKDAHPQMRELMIPLLRELQKKLPEIFDDILVYE